MFVLAEMKHVIRTPPWLFKMKLNDAIAEELNQKLANKVVLNVGLCIALHDIVSLEDSYIFPGDGAAHTKVKFRYVVFRPFIEEMEGTSLSLTQGKVYELNGAPFTTLDRWKARVPDAGPTNNCPFYPVSPGCAMSVCVNLLPVTLGFFDDIIILPTALQHPSRFDETEQAWVWEYDTGGDKHDLFMDPGESIRFRVTAESFVETSPSGPDSSERASSDTTTEETKVPYTLTVSCNLNIGAKLCTMRHAILHIEPRSRI
uniref:(California timema) hypothetical protein n=1 Tax=Timema californicum TaxID=61474 RepID=A0A7R9J4M7_TIMCA|nr:unnamed protein product [Timema californicum]